MGPYPFIYVVGQAPLGCVRYHFPKHFPVFPLKSRNLFSVSLGVVLCLRGLKTSTACSSLESIISGQLWLVLMSAKGAFRVRQKYPPDTLCSEEMTTW